MAETLITAAEPRKWAAFLNRQPHDFYHTLGYVSRAAADEGGETAAFAFESSLGTVFVPLVLRPVVADGETCGRDAISPYGYPGPLVIPSTADGAGDLIAQAAPAFLAFGHALGLASAFVRFHPLLTPQSEAWMAWGTPVHHGDTVSIDLTLGSEALWRNVRTNHKRGIKSLQAAGFAVMEDGNWTRIDEFIRAYTETMQRVGASQGYFFPEDYYRALRAEFGEDALLVLVAKEAEIVSGGIFIRTGTMAQYHLGGTRTAFLKEAPSKLLFYHAMRRFADAGARILHLGGGLGGNSDTLFNFKLGFGTHTHPFHSLRTIFDRNAYEALCAKTGTHHREEGFFPAYRAPR